MIIKKLYIIKTFFKDVYDIFVRNAGPFFKTIGVGVVAVFSAFLCVVSFTPRMWFASESLVDQISIFSGFMTIIAMFYFLLRWESVKVEYNGLHERYLGWINSRSNFQRFLVSVPLGFSLSVVQFLMIMIMKEFSHFSNPAIADTTLGIVVIINFFMMRIYLFDYRKNDYFFQIVSYTIISALALFMNYQAVEFLEIHDFWIFRPISKLLLLPFFDVTVVAQFWASVCLGWLSYKGHEKITFRK